jgi:hypothetical protein
MSSGRRLFAISIQRLEERCDRRVRDLSGELPTR